MEIDILRPIFTEYKITDSLLKINEYIHEWNYSELNNKKYCNIDKFSNTKFDKKYNLDIHYFGIYFTKKEKSFIVNTIIQYINDNILHVCSNLLNNKIIFNKKLNSHAMINYKVKHNTTISVYHVKVFMISSYYGYKRLHTNFNRYYCEKNSYHYHRSFNNFIVFPCRDVKREYYKRKDKTYLKPKNLETLIKIQY